MKTILSIDGGGMKGYIPCSVLMEIEARTGKRCCEIFDLIAGTSIGGILAGILAIGKTAAESLKFFTEDGPKIFAHTQWFGANGLCRPRYAAEPIEEKLKEIFGSETLATCKTHLLVPTFDLVSYSSCFFKTTKFDKPYELWKVARATSAAQTYFPAFEMDGKVLWDGGNLANNPAGCALAEAVKLWGRAEDFCVLSLGCGDKKSPIAASKLVSAGLLKVGIETLSLLLDANDELPDYILRQVLPTGYYRIQPKLTHDLSLDGASKDDLAHLKAEAHWCVSDAAQTITDFLRFAGIASKV